jgi:hypothetical protein
MFIFLLIGGLTIVFSGAFYRLYREQMNLKTMVSEGLMQVKEEMKAQKEAQVSPSPTPVAMKGKASPSPISK